MNGQTPVKSDSIVSYSRTADGVDFRLSTARCSVRLCTDSMVHVVFRATQGVNHPQPWIAKTNWPPVAFHLTEDANHNIVLTTSRIRIVAERDSARWSSRTRHGNVLVRESASPRRAT